MNDEIPPEEEAEYLALEKRLQEAEKQKRELEDQGWVWRGDGLDKVLSHPGDPDLNIWFHPYSGEQLLSPRLVERLKEQVNNAETK